MRAIAICLALVTAACSGSPTAPSSHTPTTDPGRLTFAEDPVAAGSSGLFVEGPTGCMDAGELSATVVWLLSNLPEDAHFSKAYQHDDEPSCDSTDRELRTQNDHLRIVSTGSATARLEWDLNAYDCGREQIDLDVNGELVLSLVIKHGTTACLPLVSAPPPPPPPPACPELDPRTTGKSPCAPPAPPPPPPPPACPELDLRTTGKSSCTPPPPPPPPACSELDLRTTGKRSCAPPPPPPPCGAKTTGKGGTQPCEPPPPKKHGCNQGVGNGDEKCDPGNSNQGDDRNSNDEHEDNEPGRPGKRGGRDD